MGNFFSKEKSCWFCMESISIKNVDEEILTNSMDNSDICTINDLTKLKERMDRLETCMGDLENKRNFGVLEHV